MDLSNTVFISKHLPEFLKNTRSKFQRGNVLSWLQESLIHSHLSGLHNDSLTQIQSKRTAQVNNNAESGKNTT